ncbi:hypothetical protein COU01_02985 [Candidatus Falkowbacteria bacterium CG10_big_fil_rev_8_21_14_0_10_44_15]|uniref:Uncharacterized protein n=1 Tax=Candidatus Falkowbacteria bacterium CG10_big_fil_rev_8_21_14_0_10_44_15 TaxID=1974569 RepID=A0A2H0UZI1_9BACT|nr:MAG: hypothetical protein COU01_02985 [Candidatus Falkowbacteria bacterium CG10_big_fil_rev_8_21_14_0_10_44_15]
MSEHETALTHNIQMKSFDPGTFLGESWTIWKGPIDGGGLSGEEDIDPRSLALSQIEITKFLFETCLKTGENWITGEERLRRLEEKPSFIRFGGNVFLGLWLDYQANGRDSALEAIYRSRGIKFLAFFGLVLRSPEGRRAVLCFCRFGGGKWDWHYLWLVYQWNAYRPSAGCAS